MAKKILFTDTERAEAMVARLKEAEKQLGEVWGYLAEKGYAPEDKADMDAIVLTRDLRNVVGRFKKEESMKILKIIDAFGKTALTDGWEDKVEAKTKSFGIEVAACLPIPEPFVFDLLPYFDVIDGVYSINPKYCFKYFLDEYSVVLSESRHFDFYEKHREACRLLNELTNRPENEFEALDRLFFFNAETKEFEMNIEAYAPGIHLKKRDNMGRVTDLSTFVPTDL